MLDIDETVKFLYTRGGTFTRKNRAMPGTLSKRRGPFREYPPFSEMMHIILWICSQDVRVSQILDITERRCALFCFILVSDRLHRREQRC